MGQGKSLQVKQTLTLEKVEESISVIFDNTQTKFSASQIAIALNRILQNMQEFLPASKTPQGFLLNSRMLKIFHHKQFLFAMGKLINLLMEKLQDLMKRSTIMITKDEWVFCVQLANFIILFSDDKLIRMVQTASVRSDLSEESRRYLQGLEKNGMQFVATESLIDRFSYNEIERIEKCLRISLYQMIEMKLQIITRSQQTLNIIEKLQNACFLLYIKTLYSPEHSQTILNKAKHEFLKPNIKIAQYFLGKGSDLRKASIYQVAVLFLFSLLQGNKQNLREFKALPSHLFKTLPIISQNTAYDFVMNICLFSLIYLKEGSNYYNRMGFNRFMTLKLVDTIITELKISSPQITFHLEELCLQTRIGQIQRSFVTDLVNNYLKIVQQRIEYNQLKKSQQKNKSTNDKQEAKQNQLKYTRQVRKSQILTKYLQAGGKQSYNVKFSNKKYKITTVDIVTEMQNDQTILQTEFRVLCEKYIYEVILNQKIMYNQNERDVWSQILPKILEDMSDEGDRDSEEEEELKKQSLVSVRPEIKDQQQEEKAEERRKSRKSSKRLSQQQQQEENAVRISVHDSEKEIQIVNESKELHSKQNLESPQKKKTSFQNESPNKQTNLEGSSQVQKTQQTQQKQNNKEKSQAANDLDQKQSVEQQQNEKSVNQNEKKNDSNNQENINQEEQQIQQNNQADK